MLLDGTGYHIGPVRPAAAAISHHYWTQEVHVNQDELVFHETFDAGVLSAVDRELVQTSV